MQTLKTLRIYFLRGMAALLPTILTIWIFVQFYIFVRDKVSVLINRVVVWLIDINTDHLTREELNAFWIEGHGKVAGILIAFLMVCFFGAFLASVVGRTLYRLFEKTLMNVPVVKKVYPYIKQITDFLLANKRISFSKVVAVQYPRKGCWSIGLVTGSGLKPVVRSFDKDVLTIFIPSSPTPFTGYVIMVPKEETIELEMSIEEGLRFTISGGVITPAQHEAFQAMAGQHEIAS